MMTANLRVLIVEDSREDFEALAELAADASAAPGAERRIILEQAGDGESAARALAATVANQGPSYAYVVLDLNLPGMSGLEFLRWARAQPALRAMPIVIFSTTTSDRERHNCFDAGANAFHVKPTSYARYRETASELFGYWGNQVAQSSTRSPREPSW
jgi:CheY-like chemotaxis protein